MIVLLFKRKMDGKCPAITTAPLPDFATACHGLFYNSGANTGGISESRNPEYRIPESPADSGVMSPMTPMSTYTQGSTPEQHYVGASPEHLYGIGNPSDSGEYYHVPSSPYPASVNSDEGVVMPKNHSYDHYENFYVSQTYLTYSIPNTFHNRFWNSSHYLYCMNVGQF